MYEVCTSLKDTKHITVIDLTKKFEKEDNCPPAYKDNNTEEYTFEGTVFKDYEGKEYTFPLKDYQTEEIEENYGYQNIELMNPSWPTKLQLLQDYGNHYGCPPNNYIHEDLILIGNYNDESLGWFDGYYVIAVRFINELFLYKICKADEIDMDKIRDKRPFSIWFYTKDEYETDDSTVWCSIYIQGNEAENCIEKEVELENLKVRDFYNRQMCNFSLQNWHNGYYDQTVKYESEGTYDYIIGQTVKKINKCNRKIEEYSKSDDENEYYSLMKMKRQKEELKAELMKYCAEL